MVIRRSARLLFGWTFALALFFQPLFIGPVFATDGADQFKEISKRVLHKELELLSYDSRFRAHYLAPNKSQQRRLKLYDMAAGGVANGGDITLISQFSRYRTNPGLGLAHRGALESGAIIVLVAYLVLGGFYAGDGMYDLVCDYKAKCEHWDAKSVLQRGKDLTKEIDDALAVRSQAVACAPGLSNNQLATLTAEGKVLKDVRDLSVFEFSRLYLDSRKRHTERELTTIGTLAVCATGAFPGAYGVIRGLKKTDLKTVGGGGIGFLVSGSTLTGAPALIYGSSAIVGKLTEAKLAKALGDGQTKTTATLEQDTAALSSTMKVGGEPIATAVDSKDYSKLADFVKEREAFLNNESARRKRDILESFLSYGLRGGPQIAWGTMLTRAGYHFTAQPVKAFGAIRNAAIVNETSWGVWLADCMQKGARNEMRSAKDQKTVSAIDPSSQDLKVLESMVP